MVQFIMGVASIIIAPKELKAFGRPQISFGCISHDTVGVCYVVQDNDYAKNYYESDESRGDDEDDNLDADGYY